MTLKNWLLIVIALALGVVYAVWFTDWFRSGTVTIFHTSRTSLRALRTRPQPGGLVLPNLTFGLDRQLKLTEIRVVQLAAWQTNHSVLPLWHLVTSSNSAPVKSFTYGELIHGLKPAVAGTYAQPLEPQVTYRLIVTAGKIHGEHDFQIADAPATAR